MFKKVSLLFKKLHQHDQVLISIFGLCLLIGLIWGVYLLLNTFTLIVPINGGSMKYGVWEQPRLINPVTSQNNDTDSDLINLIYDGLLSLGADGKFVNELASSMTVSKDEKIYEIKLRENVLWHDSVAFNSDDVLFTIDMIQGLGNESPLYNIWKDVRAEKVGDYMVRFYLTQPRSQFVSNLTLKILPKHIWSNINPRQYLMTEYNLKPIGTGPYMYKKLVKDKSGKIVSYYLEKNNKYFKHIPYINEIIVNFYDNADNAFTALIKGKIDLIKEISYYQKELLKKRRSIVLTRLSVPRYYGIFFNQKSSLLKNPSLIKAFDLAINKKSGINESLYGEAEILNVPISKDFLGYALNLNAEIYNKAEARNILTGLGYVDVDGDGLVEKSVSTGTGKKKVTKVSKLELTIITPSINELAQLAQNIKIDLESIGVKTNVNIVPLQDIYKDYLKTRSFDAILFGEAYGLNPDLYLFWHSSQINDPGLNISMFSDSEIDKLLEENRFSSNKEIINTNLIKIQERLLEKRPLITLGNPYFLYAKDKNIKGNSLLIVNSPNDKFENIEDWYIHTGRKIK